MLTTVGACSPHLCWRGSCSLWAAAGWGGGGRGRGLRSAARDAVGQRAPAAALLPQAESVCRTCRCSMAWPCVMFSPHCPSSSPHGISPGGAGEPPREATFSARPWGTAPGGPHARLLAVLPGDAAVRSLPLAPLLILVLRPLPPRLEPAEVLTPPSRPEGWGHLLLNSCRRSSCDLLPRPQVSLAAPRW